MKRNVYLNTIDISELDSLFDKLLSERVIETIDVKLSIGRVTSSEVIALLSSPFYNASAMDGIAVKHLDTVNASETNLVRLTNYEYVNTGNPIPIEYDAVIMIEDINEIDGIHIIKPAKLFQHIRPIGEDIVMGEMIIPRNHKIRPIDLSAIIAGGLKTVDVIKKPKVTIIPTGTEIIDDPDKMEIGKILDSNSYFIKSALDELGAVTKVVSVQKDEFSVLRSVVSKACDDSDLVIIGAGSSAGSKDYTKAIIEELGEVFVHGINIKPGKPTIIGKIGNAVVIGLPGYPVSTYVSFDLVVKPLIEKVLSYSSKRKIIKAKLVKKVYSSLKHHEFVRVKLGRVGGVIVCSPLDRGAGVTMSLVKADGLMIIPKDIEGFNPGIVEVELLNSKYENTIVSIGSHDLAMDYINDELTKSGFSLSSSHVGSYGGVIAIKKGECHIAPVHVLEDGLYNEFLIEKYDLDAVLLKGLKRIQGIIIKKSNPKEIKGLNDLRRVNFVNRQSGSGTRILFDSLLDANNIDSNEIDGYDYELTTHMTVASAVKDGRADAGICTKAVADLMGLNFIKLAEEEYDFLVRTEFVGTESYNKFKEIIESKELLEKLGDSYRK